VDPTERQPYAPPDLEGLRSPLERILAAPLPETLQERLDLLERHLRENLPAATDAPGAEELTQKIRFIREVVAEVDGMTSESAVDFKECDQASMAGVAAITIGCVIGPHAGLLAFGWVYHLTQHCHE
jgi:hypothetical protein